MAAGLSKLTDIILAFRILKGHGPPRRTMPLQDIFKKAKFGQACSLLRLYLS
jgi:hypothetical protein